MTARNTSTPAAAPAAAAASPSGGEPGNEPAAKPAAAAAGAARGSASAKSKAGTYRVRNTAKGPRGFGYGPDFTLEVMLEPKQQSGAVELTADDVQRLEDFGDFQLKRV